MKYKKTRQFIENNIILCQLKFERAERRGTDGAHDMNIACAQKEWWEGELKKLDRATN